MNINSIRRVHILKMIDYCYETFGSSKYQKYLPFLKIDYKGKIYPHMGEYRNEENEIIINLPAHNSVIELCSTIIHEYVHYLQNMEKYDRLYKKTSYHDHPFEHEANLTANEYKWECRRYIKNN